MRMRMRRALPLLLLLLLLAPASAIAQDEDPSDPEAPPAETDIDTGTADSPDDAGLDYDGPSARISRGAPLVFAVRTSAPAGSVAIRVSSSDETDTDGLLAGEDGEWVDETATPDGDGLQTWTAPASSLLRQRPGHYFWQAYLAGAAADESEEPVGPVRELVVTQPMAYRGRGRLFPKFGHRGGASFYLSSAGFPATVTGKRFQAVAKKTGARWGLKALRWTTAVAGQQDGFNVAGFSSAVPKDVLGVETDYTLRGRVIERDLALNADENWFDGPDYPALDEVDLESVLLHELGHMAGNKRHRKRCANSPMIESLGEGEWWRGARDHWFADCTSTALASRAGTLVAGAQRRGALQHRVISLD
jgi:hypothetical protein